MKTTLARRLFVLALLIMGMAAHAAVVLDGTRVIYPSDRRDVTVRLKNMGDVPGLVQSWIDTGDPGQKPETLDVPFSITPSMFRMEPGRSQVLRLVYLGGQLPGDRESVFWLNVLEVPPKPADASQTNYLQFAVKTRIKIFYRPVQLREAPEDAVKALRWERVSAEGERLTVKVINPTPFHVSFGRLAAVGGSPDGTVNGMVAPFADATFVLKTPGMPASNVSRIQFNTINDYGATIDGEARLP